MKFSEAPESTKAATQIFCGFSGLRWTGKVGSEDEETDETTEEESGGVETGDEEERGTETEASAVTSPTCADARRFLER